MVAPLPFFPDQHAARPARPLPFCKATLLSIVLILPAGGSPMSLVRMLAAGG